MYSIPFIINEDQETELLDRLPFGEGFTEQWLQIRLFENPNSLPFSEIDPAYQQVCPLCMEMNTSAGPIDIIYITPQGRLVVVETKLWRNPEARRKVIGQILDYAKELKQWGYADLQRELSRRTGIKGNSPFKLVSEKFPDINEAAFVDGVTQSLQRGDFMLILAGDGIRKEAQGIVNFLEDVAQMRFVLAMIEIAVYKHKKKELFVVQPRTLVKTQTLKRDITQFGPNSLPPTDEESDNKIEEWRLVYKEYWTRFLDKLTLDDPEQPMANATSTGNLTFPLPPSGGVAWLTTYFYKKNRNVGCFLRLINNSTGHDLYQALLDEKEEIERDLPFPVDWNEELRTVERYMPIKGEWPPVNDEEVDKFLAETINALVNTFRPRLERLSGN